MELREARIAEKLTIKQAADCVGVSATTWSRWEKGTQYPLQAQRRNIYHLFDKKVTFKGEERHNKTREVTHMEAEPYAFDILYSVL